MRPKSSSFTLIWRRSMARIVSSSIGISYVLPVRLSVIVSVCEPVAVAAPSCCWVSVVIALLRGRTKGQSDSSTRVGEARRLRCQGDRFDARLLTRGDGHGDRRGGQHEADQDDGTLTGGAEGKCRAGEPNAREDDSPHGQRPARDVERNLGRLGGGQQRCQH